METLYKAMRKNLVLTVILASLSLGLFTGCSQSTPEANLAPPQAVPAPSPDTPPQATPTPSQDTTPEAAPAPSPDTPPTAFYLEVTQPADNSIINVGTVEVMGRTSPGAVVSVNDEIAVADTQGTFVVTIALEEGPNIIEVIASDDEGSEARASLTVTLVKGE